MTHEMADPDQAVDPTLAHARFRLGRAASAVNGRSGAHKTGRISLSGSPDHSHFVKMKGTASRGMEYRSRLAPFFDGLPESVHQSHRLNRETNDAN